MKTFSNFLLEKEKLFYVSEHNQKLFHNKKREKCNLTNFYHLIKVQLLSLFVIIS